jgi:HEAT repeat protein
MVAAFGRLFSIRPDEWRRLILLTVMLLMFVTGGIWASITITSQFLSKLGADNVPYMLIGDALIIVVTFAVYSSIADRFSNSKILNGLLIIGIIGIVVSLLLINNPDANISNFAYLILYLHFRAVTEAISVHWGVYVNDFFDTRAAKRIFTLLGAVVRIGNILAALTIPLLNLLPNNAQVIVILWGVSMFLMMMINFGKSFFLRGSQGIIEARQIGSEAKKASYFQRLREGYEFVFTSGYLRMFAIGSLFMMFLMAAMQFKIFAIFADTYGSDDVQISNLISQITLIGSLLLLPFQLFIYNRILSRIGVENANLIFPLSSMGAALMLAFNNSLPVGAITEFNRTILNGGIRAVNDELLYNAIPIRVKGRARAFMSGIVQPLGTMAGGLLVALPIMNESWFLPMLLIVLAVAYVLSALMVSRLYGRALISMIEQENYAFLLDAQNRISVDNESVKSLEKRLAESDIDDTRLILARLLIAARGVAYIPLLSSYADNGSSYLRAGIIDAFVAGDVNHPDVVKLCLNYMGDPAALVRKSAIMGLKQLSGASNEQYLISALEVLHEQDLGLQLEVLPDLLNAHDFYFVKFATEKLNEYLYSDKPQKRAMGVQLLGRTNSRHVIKLLLTYVTDKTEVVRLQTMIAIENLVLKARLEDSLGQELRQQIVTLLHDPIERVRLATVRIIGSINSNDLAESLIPALVDRSLEIREAAVGLLVKQPRKSQEAFLPLLHSEHPALNRMASVVLVRIKPDYQEHVFRNVDLMIEQSYRNLSRIETLKTIEHYPSIGILQSLLQEQNQEMLQEIFYLIGSVHGASEVAITAEALSSTVERTRANAVEALDVMLSQRLLEVFVPLTDSQLKLNQITDYGRRFYGIKPMSKREVLEAILASRDEDWMRYIVVSALGEMGQKLKAAQSASKASPLDLLASFGAPAEVAQADETTPYTLAEIEALFESYSLTADANLNQAVRKARMMVQANQGELASNNSTDAIAEVERVIFLKQVAFFRDMSIRELRNIGQVCQEADYEVDTKIFTQGDTGGRLYVILSGRIGIERMAEGGRSSRIKTLETANFFGEDTLFDKGKIGVTALTLAQSHVLILEHDSMLGLIQSYPDVSLKLLKALSQEVRSSKQHLNSLGKNERSHNLFERLDLS